MGLKLGLNLGYWGIGPQGDEATEMALAAERAGFDSVWAAESYGSDAVSVLAYLAAKTETIQLGAAILQVPARQPGSRRDGRRHDRRALGWPLHLRFRSLRPAGLRGLVRRPIREALGPDPRVRRDRQADRRARRPPGVRGQALHAAAEGGRGRHRAGQGAQAQHSPAAERDPDLPGRDRPQVGGARRGGGRRLDPDLLLGRQVAGGLGRAHRGRPVEGRPDARGPPGLAVGPGRDRRGPRRGPRHGQGRAAALPRRHGLEEDELLRRPDAPLRLRRGGGRGPDRSTWTASARRRTPRSPTSWSTPPR